MKTDHVPGSGRRAPAQGVPRGAGPQDGVPEWHSGPPAGPLAARGLARRSAELRGPGLPTGEDLWFCQTVNLGRCCVSKTNR